MRKYSIGCIGMLFLFGGMMACDTTPTKTKEKSHSTEMTISEQEGKVMAEKRYSDGNMQTTGELVDSTKKNGLWKYWYEDGTLWSECYFENGIKQGATKVYYKSGKVKYEGFYTQNKPSGLWSFYLEDGTPEKQINYDEK